MGDEKMGKPMGPPQGNVNGVKHGLRSKRHGLVHAKLGKRFANAYGHSNSLRKAVEALLRERHGCLSLLQQAKVQSLLRLEEGVRALEKTMVETPDMDADGVLKARYAIAQWTVQRDTLLAELVGDGDVGGMVEDRLDAAEVQDDSPNPWDSLDETIRAERDRRGGEATSEILGCRASSTPQAPHPGQNEGGVGRKSQGAPRKRSPIL